MRTGYWFGRTLRMLLIVVVVLAVASFAVMSLWNWLVPALFSGPPVNYWQALGLLVLSRLLLSGRPRGGPGGAPFGPGRGPWSRGHAFRSHWSRMTPEERADVRERLRDRRWRGGRPRAPEPNA